MQVTELLSREDVAALLAQANTRCATGLRNRAILEVMVNGGLRIAEVASLEARYVTFTADGANLIVHGKGGKTRPVPLDKASAQWLDTWDRQRPRSPRFFTTIQGKPVSTSYIRQMVYRYAKRAGIQEEIGERADGKPKLKVHPHSLRLTYGSSKLAEGYTIAEVRDLLGHSSLKTTDAYVKVSPDALRAKVQGQQTLEQQVATLTEQVAKLTAALAGE